MFTSGVSQQAADGKPGVAGANDDRVDVHRNQECAEPIAVTQLVTTLMITGVGVVSTS
jgi:hypothetical protein